VKTKKLLRPFLIVAATVGVLGVVLIPALFRAREEARKSACLGNLKQIGLAMAIYANDHDDNYPPTLNDLMPKYLTDEGLFHCPSDRSDKPSYLYVPGFTAKDRAMAMVVIERGGIHAHGRHVLFVDGHVWFRREADFQDLWTKQREEFKLPNLKELGDTVEEGQPVPAGSRPSS
jgi:prepilin-type processing-associated H-X9-DG protein